MAYNHLTIQGNLTKDIELRQVSAGGEQIPVCTVRVAVNRKKKDSGVDYFDVELWRKEAENAAKYLAKGSSVIAEGEINLDTFKGKEGNDIPKLVLRNAHVTYLSSKGTNGQGSNGVEIPPSLGQAPDPFAD